MEWKNNAQQSNLNVNELIANNRRLREYNEELQLLLDKANEQLQKGNIPVVNSRFVANHRWKRNDRNKPYEVCIHCGICRTKVTQKILMAIDYHGKDYYRYKQRWLYSGNNGYIRPQCVKKTTATK